MSDSLPVKFDPVDVEMLGFIQSTPPSWARVNKSAMTAVQETAHRMLVAAGLIEEQIHGRAWMAGERAVLHVRLRASGNYGDDDLNVAAAGQVPWWFASGPSSLQRFHLQYGNISCRLTEQGQYAQAVWRGNFETVLAFVRGPGRYKPAVVSVEASRVDASAVDGADGSASPTSTATIGAMAAAKAEASIGDTIINNNMPPLQPQIHVHINNTMPAVAAAGVRAMTQAKLAESVGCSAELIYTWAKAANVRARAHQNEEYSEDEVRSILEYGKTNGQKAKKEACRRILKP